MKLRIACILLLLPLLGNAQGSVLSSLLATTPQSNHQVIRAKVDRFIAQQKQKKTTVKNEIRFLNALVKQTHRKFLKNYKAYSSFSEAFENGNYDCLTGTSLFSLALDELGFAHKIIETNYHIFLLVETADGEILLETTDRLAGFKTKTKEIEQSIALYKKNVLAATAGDKQYYLYQTNLYREINAMQLGGLLFFNQAVVAFNQHDWVTCVDRLEKSRTIYNNPRVEELTEIAMGSIALSDLEEGAKNALLSNLKKHLKSSHILAAR